jgi:hypothetical protein
VTKPATKEAVRGTAASGFELLGGGSGLVAAPKVEARAGS